LALKVFMSFFRFAGHKLKPAVYWLIQPLRLIRCCLFVQYNPHMQPLTPAAKTSSPQPNTGKPASVPANQGKAKPALEFTLEAGRAASGTMRVFT